MLSLSRRFSPSPIRITNFTSTLQHKRARPRVYPSAVLEGVSRVNRFSSFTAKPHRSTSRASQNGGWLVGALLFGGVVGLTSLRLAEADSKQNNDNNNKEKSGPIYRPSPDMRIFSGRANPALAQEIAENLGVPLSNVAIRPFADGEIGIQVYENVRGKDVYIIQPTSPPGVNDHLMELILLISTMRRASARTITAVIPYYGYARQDRKMQSRVPISAADVARLLESMGLDRVVAVDLHCGQIQGFFSPSTPCDNLEGAAVAIRHFTSLGLKGESTVVVSPDAGGVYRAKNFRDGLKHHGLDAGLAMIVKQRARANAIERMDLVGSVQDSDCIIVDDIIDTAGTLCKAADELKARGAKRVYAFATHGLFSGEALDRIKSSSLEQVVVCNTIPLRSDKKPERITQLSIAHLIAQAIDRIQHNQSVSSLFK